MTITKDQLVAIQRMVNALLAQRDRYSEAHDLGHDILIRGKTALVALREQLVKEYNGNNNH
jgi:hypothetical protein